MPSYIGLDLGNVSYRAVEISIKNKKLTIDKALICDTCVQEDPKKSLEGLKEFIKSSGFSTSQKTLWYLWKSCWHDVSVNHQHQHCCSGSHWMHQTLLLNHCFTRRCPSTIHGTRRLRFGTSGNTMVSVWAGCTLCRPETKSSLHWSAYCQL